MIYAKKRFLWTILGPIAIERENQKLCYNLFNYFRVESLPFTRCEIQLKYFLDWNELERFPFCTTEPCIHNLSHLRKWYWYSLRTILIKKNSTKKKKHIEIKWNLHLLTEYEYVENLKWQIECSSSQMSHLH